MVNAKETVASVMKQDGPKVAAEVRNAEKKMVANAANKKDHIEGLLSSEKSEGDAEVMNPQKRHFGKEEAAKASAEDPPQKRHFPGENGETSSADVRSSIRLVEARPKDSGDLVAVDDEPTDLSKAGPRPSKRVFPHAGDETEESEPRKARKVVDSAANKRDRVLNDDGTNQEHHGKARKHFDKVGNGNDHVSELMPFAEGDNSSKKNKNIQADHSGDRPAGLTSLDQNRPQTAPTKAPEPQGAGRTSADINHPPNAAHGGGATADAKKKAMSGSTMASCLAWQNPHQQQQKH